VIRRVITLVVVVAMVLGASVPTAAAAKKESQADRQRRERREQIKAQISNLKDQVKEASEEESELLGRLDDVQSRRADLDADVADLDDQISDVQQDIDAASTEFDRLTAGLVQAQLRLDAATEQERVARDELRDRAVEAYINNPHLTAAGMVMEAGSLRELAAGRDYYRAIVASRRDSLERYSSLKDQTEALRKDVEDKRTSAKAQHDVVLGQRKKLEAARARHDVVRQEVVAQEREQESVLDQLRDRKAEFQGQIAALQTESSAISQLLQGIQVGQIVIPPGSGRLATPVPGARITSTFGPRTHPIFGDVRTHTGVDFGVGSGTPIRAAGDGTVVYAGPRGGYGNTTIIDHGSSLATLYAHQSNIHVSVGQRVSRGQVIGAVGSTGYSTGPHLHFEVRVNGTPVDPLPYL
jgi:murein DD-endopeptidase MepM/ murein hydrolase activator NlpD